MLVANKLIDCGPSDVFVRLYCIAFFLQDPFQFIYENYPRLADFN